jgi:hypothetical protein
VIGIMNHRSEPSGPPVPDLRLAALAPVCGAITGLYPAWRAASMEPVDALRSGTSCAPPPAPTMPTALTIAGRGLRAHRRA